jgi:hypothetical protein
MGLTGKFDIYKVHNLPVPVHNMTTSSNPNSMVAHFDLETHYFAVNKDKTKYSLLDNCTAGQKLIVLTDVLFFVFSL